MRYITALLIILFASTCFADIPGWIRDNNDAPDWVRDNNDAPDWVRDNNDVPDWVRQPDVRGPRDFPRAKSPVEINREIQKAIQHQRLNHQRPNPIRRPVLVNKVGYGPVIIWLPQGTNMGVSAVVSPDRRYVRIGARPMFSGIGPVYTFSYRR